jgi:exodeoxyribonuclease VII large subunit
MSDSDTTMEFDFSDTCINDKKQICTINNKLVTLLEIIHNHILSDKRMKKIILTVDIIEIKDYNGMAFLKVKDETASIPAVIYKSINQNDLAIGDKIKISAQFNLYGNQLQLVIKSYEKNGLVDNSQFILVRTKLQKMGYMDNKPILENNYTNIGIISSLSAAGMKDFLHIINERCSNKNLYIYPSTMQGKNAANEIINAIATANKHGIVNIIVLIRGGGSKEDLECFNLEKLAISIHCSKIPIVTGIGHQIDMSIADLVCAKSFITPTAVAQNITKENTNSKKILDKLLSSINHKLINHMDQLYECITRYENKLAKCCDNILNDMGSTITLHKNNLNIVKKKISLTMDDTFDYIMQHKNRLDSMLSDYSTNIGSIMTLHNNRLTLGHNMCGQKIKIYDKQHKILTAPHIFDIAGNEIKTLEEFLPGKKYKISFIDGTFDLNLK